MAFKGDLTNISLFDVFQTLNTNQQTGVLVLQRDGVTKKVFISPEGVRIFFTRSFRPIRLGEIFVKRGMITPQDVEILLLHQKQEYKPIGELLVESGKVSQDEVSRVLQAHAEDEIFEIFAWKSGSFSFYDGDLEERSATPLSEVLMDPSGLCLEAARRMDELEQLRGSIPSNTEFFVRSSDLEPDREQTAPIACDVFDMLAPAQSVDDLRDLLGLSLFDALRAIGVLANADLIRVLTQEELIEEGRVAHHEGRKDRAARLFEKAHELDPQNIELLEECVSVVQEISEPHRLAQHLASLGSLCNEQGLPDAAIEYLEQALRHDSDNFDALFALRDAFAQAGDLDRSAETSLKIARAHAEEGHLPNAIDACRQGLKSAPHGIALRYYLGQLLVRADRPEEAQQELYQLVGETESDRKVMKSSKAHELLTSCYRLLLKIDPEDAQAHTGLRSLDRRRITTLRRQKVLLRVGVVVAFIAVVTVVAITLGTTSAGEWYERAMKAQSEHNYEAMLEAVNALEDQYPESPETQKAMAMRRKHVDERSRREKTIEDRRSKTRAKITEQYEETKSMLVDGEPLPALSQVKALLDRLRQPGTAFLRKEMQSYIEYEIIAFLERISKDAVRDRQEVAISEHKLKAKKDQTTETLKALAQGLSKVRNRDWPALAPDLIQSLEEIGRSPFIGVHGKQAIADFGKRMASSLPAFENLDDLFFTVRAAGRRSEIKEAVALARDRGFIYLSDCKFKLARDLYQSAFEKADSVMYENPRKQFRGLLLWLEQNHITAEMKRRRDQVDEVIETLAKVEKLRKKSPDEAYLLLRDLVLRHVVIRFEKKYTMPYLVKSTPAGALVWVDDKSVGKTPVALELDIVRPTEVRVLRAGFDEKKVRINPLGPELTGTLDITLQKRLSWNVEVGGQVEAAPVVTKGLVLIATSNADLVALSLKDGIPEWEAKSKLLDRIKAAPVVCGDLAYFVTMGGMLHEVRLKDGHINDRKQLDGAVHTDMVWDGKRLYVATRNRRLIALEGMTIVYSREIARAPATRLLVDKGVLYFGTAEGEVLMLSTKDGTEIRRGKTEGGSSLFGGLAIHGTLVVAGAEDGALYAFDRKTGDLAWTYPTTGPVTVSPISDGRFIYLPARDGWVYAVDVAGEQRVRYDVGNAVEDAPAMVGRFLYAIGGNRVAAFDTTDDVEVSWWEYAFDEDAPIRIASGNDVVIVITLNGRVVAFPRDQR